MTVIGPPIVVTSPPAPEWADGDACEADGRTADGDYMLCNRNRGHEGDHWDGFDKVYWKEGER